MKQIIEIPEELRIEITRIGLLRISDEKIGLIDRAIQCGTVLPDNATNDDVLKALFDERGYMGIHDRMMHTKWLFAPYQKGDKE